MTDHKQISLFLNCASRSGKGKRCWKHFLHRGYDAVYSDDGTDFVDLVARDANEVAVAVGGDGTINLVINGIMASGKPKTLGVLYAGTSPDFCLFHQIPIDPQESVKCLSNGRKVLIDLAEVSHDGQSGWFASSCNIGLGATVAATSNRIRKYWGDFLGTLISSIIAIIKTPAFNLDISVDGAPSVSFKGIRNVTVLKNNFIASGLRLNLPSQPDDGIMHAVVIRKMNLKTLAGLYRGVVPKGAEVLTGKRFNIQSDTPVTIEYDGDPQDMQTPVAITCHRQILPVIKPQPLSYE